MKTSTNFPSAAIGQPTAPQFFGAALLFSLLLFAAPAQAATITVTNGNDTGSGSLRTAISSAASGDIIQFSGVTTVTLTSAQLLIGKNLTFNGGSPGVTVTRSGSTVFRIFEISSGFTVTMNNLTISNGSHATQAGGVQNYGTLTMNNCVLTGNTAPQGGGMRNDNVLTMKNCIFYANTATTTLGNSNAGTALVVSGSAGTNLFNCVFTGNLGGGSLFGYDTSNGYDNFTVTNSIFYNNTGYIVYSPIVLNYNIIIYSGTGTLNVNPYFVNAADPDGADNIWRTADDGLRVTGCSQALNTGTNTGAPTTDILGNPRPYNSGTADRGAYEIQNASPTCAKIGLNGNGYSIGNNDNTPSTYDGTFMGYAAVSSGSLTKTYVIKNTGTTTLNLTGNPKVSVGGTNPGDFTVSAQPPATVAAGGSATFTVTFDPTAVGNRQATLTILSDDETNSSPFNFDVGGGGESLPPVFMSNGSSTGCGFNFYDSGGPAGDYSNSQNYTYTFNPSSANDRVRATFNTFSLSYYDNLTVYDGTSTADPILFGPATNSTYVPVLVSTTGSLTFKFKSSSSYTGPGWFATIDCVTCSGAPAASTTTLLTAATCSGYPFTLGLGTAYNETYSYQWQDAAASGGPFANIAGATQSTLTATLPSTTSRYYRCNITCSLSNQTTTSTVRTVTPSGSTFSINCPANMTVCSNPVNYPTVTGTATNSACIPSYFPGYTFLGAYNGHHYFLSDGTAYWTTASSSATLLGGYLAAVTSSGEKDFLVNAISQTGGGFWLGANDATTEGTFVWLSGEAFSYTNWGFRRAEQQRQL